MKTMDQLEIHESNSRVSKATKTINPEDKQDWIDAFQEVYSDGSCVLHEGKKSDVLKITCGHKWKLKATTLSY